MRSRRRALFAATTLIVTVLAGVAWAFWTSTDSSNPAGAVADTVSAANLPTLSSVNGQDVALAWTASTTAAGAGVSGYTLARYSLASGGVATAATGGCTGVVAATSCTEQSTPAGTWFYAVTPRISLWAGAESARRSVTVVAPSFTITASQVRKTPGTVSGGVIAHFENNESFVVHLDTAGGTSLTSSVTTVDGTGAASAFTITIPTGPVDGTHNLVVVGAGGSLATSGTFTVDNTAPVTTDNSATIGAGWFNTTKTVTLTPTDGAAGVSATYYTTDGSTPTTGSTQGTSVALATDGVYTVKYFSVDTLGNTEGVKTAGTVIHIDKTAPATVALSVPTFVKNGQTLSDAATDPTVNTASSGVVSVAYYYCAGAACTPATTLIGTGVTGASFGATWNSQPADGAYRLQAKATDAAGNVSAATAIVGTTVDNTAPSGGSVTYTNGYFTAASVAVTFANGTDAGSGLSTATAQLQSAPAGLTNGNCGTFGSFTNDGPAGGASPYADTSVTSGNCYMYRYLVSDNVGNSQTYTSANVAKVDTSAPIFTVTSSGANVFATGTTVYFKTAGAGSFTVTASDAQSGIGTPTFPAAPTGWTISGSGNARTYTLGAATVSSSIAVSATNGAGTNSGSQTITITVDTTAPVPTAGVIAPIDNTTGTANFVHAGGQYYVYAIATDAGSGIANAIVDVSTVTAGQTAVAMAAGSYPAFGTTYTYRSAAITADAGLTAGAKAYGGTTTDNVGNAVVSPVGSASVTVDNTAPTGSVTTAVTGWATASTIVTATSADATAGVNTVTFQYRTAGSGGWTDIVTDTGTPYTATWDTTALTNGGSYDLRAITTDNASNAFTSATVTVTVDRTAPAAPSTPVLSVGSDSGVVGDNRTNDTTPTVTGTAEAGSTVKVFDGVTQVGSGTATGGNYSITSSTLGTGAHTLTATATDPAGNVSTASSGLTVTIDTTAPTPTAVTLANGGTLGRIDAGDTVSITYSEVMDATKFCTTWTNTGNQSATAVTVSISATDVLTVQSSSCSFKLGSVTLTGNYVTAVSTFNSSSFSWNPTTKVLVLTLGGTFTGTRSTGILALIPQYTPDVALADTAGNAMAATAFPDPSATRF